MSDCDHKFIDTNVCVRCGESYGNILKVAYNRALKELNDAGKQERTTATELNLQRSETDQLRKRVAKLTEENDHVRKSFLLSQEARTEWIKNLDAMRAEIADWKKRWEESPYPAAEVAQEQIRALRAKVAELQENNDGLLRQWKELAALLDRVPHNQPPGDFGGVATCYNCPRCAWEKMKSSGP